MAKQHGGKRAGSGRPRGARDKHKILALEVERAALMQVVLPRVQEMASEGRQVQASDQCCRHRTGAQF